MKSPIVQKIIAILMLLAWLSAAGHDFILELVDLEHEHHSSSASHHHHQDHHHQHSDSNHEKEPKDDGQNSEKKSNRVLIGAFHFAPGVAEISFPATLSERNSLDSKPVNHYMVPNLLAYNRLANAPPLTVVAISYHLHLSTYLGYFCVYPNAPPFLA